MIRALGLVGIAIITGGCTSTPAEPSRLTDAAPPVYPDDSSWRHRDVSQRPEGDQPVPEWVTPLDAYASGFLYDIPGAIKQQSADNFAHYLLYICCADENSFPQMFQLGCPMGEWEIGGVSNAVIGVVSTPKEREAVGTCFYLTGLLGLSDQETALVTEFNNRGWRVIVVWPSVQTYHHGATMLVMDDSEEQHAKILAREVDAYLSDTACGAESVVRWLAAKDPTFQDRPVVVAGGSLGAISAPTVIARLRISKASRVDAAILIGGGSNLFLINGTSPVTRERTPLFGATRLNDGSDAMNITALGIDFRERIAPLVLQHAKLDPAHTAGALRDLPVLMLHAPDDQIVAASLGDDLYERLGRPERWEYPFGHTGLFFALPFESHRIARWAEQNVLSAPNAGPVSTHSYAESP